MKVLIRTLEDDVNFKFLLILMVSAEASWWNILLSKMYTTLGYIVSQNLLLFRNSIKSSSLSCRLLFNSNTCTSLQMNFHEIGST